MRVGNRGTMMLMTTAGAFCAFSLMTIAVGTDYWLYSRGMCRSKTANDNETIRKNEEVLTHSGLWRTCCTEGTFRGVCKDIDHFAEDDYEQDAAEYLLRGVCVAASEFYKSRHNVILSAGILFVSAGLSNIIGIIVYISANSGDPSQSDHKKSYSYGWSFYFGALSFVLAEMVGVLAVHVFIEKHRQLRTHGRPSLMKPPFAHSSSYYRNRYYQNRSRRYSTRSVHSMGEPAATRPSFHGGSLRDGETLFSSGQESKGNGGSPGSQTMTLSEPEFMLYTLATPPPLNDVKINMAADVDAVNHSETNHIDTEMLPGNCAVNRRTTPV